MYQLTLEKDMKLNCKYDFFGDNIVYRLDWVVNHNNDYVVCLLYVMIVD